MIPLNFFLYNLQTEVIFGVLDNILKESNRESFLILQERGVGSEGVLNQVERYGLYVAQVLEIDGGLEQSRVGIGNNIGIGLSTYSTKLLAGLLLMFLLPSIAGTEHICS